MDDDMELWYLERQREKHKEGIDWYNRNLPRAIGQKDKEAVRDWTRVLDDREKTLKEVEKKIKKLDR